MTIALGPGIVVQVVPPEVPTVIAPAPSSGTVIVPVIGPPGPPGPAGANGGTGYHHLQLSAVDTWTIVHSLGYRPGGITSRDSSGDPIEGGISYPDVNTVVLTFPGRPVSGTAELS